MYRICLSIHSDSFQIKTLADSDLTCNMLKMNVWSVLVANMYFTKLYDGCKTVLMILFVFIKQAYKWIFLKCQIRVLLSKFSLSFNCQQLRFIFNSFLVVVCVAPELLENRFMSMIWTHWFHMVSTHSALLPQTQLEFDIMLSLHGTRALVVQLCVRVCVSSTFDLSQ